MWKRTRTCNTYTCYEAIKSSRSVYFALCFSSHTHRQSNELIVMTSCAFLWLLADVQVFALPWERTPFAPKINKVEDPCVPPNFVSFRSLHCVRCDFTLHLARACWCMTFCVITCYTVSCNPLPAP